MSIPTIITTSYSQPFAEFRVRRLRCLGEPSRAPRLAKSKSASLATLHESLTHTAHLSALVTETRLGGYQGIDQPGADCLDKMGAPTRHRSDGQAERRWGRGPRRTRQPRSRGRAEMPAIGRLVRPTGSALPPLPTHHAAQSSIQLVNADFLQGAAVSTRMKSIAFCAACSAMTSATFAVR
jgi:hypothetical protein